MNWSATLPEMQLITKISKRAVAVANQRDQFISFGECEMDITACHCNGCPLDLEKFLAFDDANFMHDVYGIRRHIDRHTGEIGDCFVPRCAARETAST